MKPYIVLTSFLIALAFALPAQSDAPPGMQEVKVKRLDTVYSKPDTDWAQYSGIYVEPLDLSGAEIDVPSGTRKMDVPKLTDDHIAMFQELYMNAFTREFTEDGLFATEAAAKDGALVLRTKVLVIAPSYIPDRRMQYSGRNKAYTENAGKMTLQFDFVDGKTGELLARAVDRREPTRMWRENNPVQNRSQVSQLMGSWARIVRTNLEELIRPQTR